MGNHNFRVEKQTALPTSIPMARPGTTMTPISQLRPNDYVIISDRPCKIDYLNSVKTSQLNGDCHCVFANDIFNGFEVHGRFRKLYYKTKRGLEMPLITQKTYLLQEILDDDSLVLDDEETGETRGDLSMPMPAERAIDEKLIAERVMIGGVGAATLYAAKGRAGPGGEGPFRKWAELRESIRSLFDEGKNVLVTILRAEFSGEEVVVAAREDPDDA